MHWLTFERLQASHDLRVNAGLAGMAVSFACWASGWKGSISPIDGLSDCNGGREPQPSFHSLAPPPSAR